MKNFIKNNLKLIIGFIAGIILASGIAVYASVNANSIDYTNNKKVSDALNELYTTSSTYKKLDVGTTATADDILTGKTAYSSSGELITGLKDLTPTFGTPLHSGYRGTRTTTDTTSLNLNKGKYLIIFSQSQSWGRSEQYNNDFETYDHSESNLTYTNNCNLQFISCTQHNATATTKVGTCYIANYLWDEVFYIDVISNNTTITTSYSDPYGATSQVSIIHRLIAIPIS